MNSSRTSKSNSRSTSGSTAHRSGPPTDVRNNAYRSAAMFLGFLALCILVACVYAPANVIQITTPQRDSEVAGVPNFSLGNIKIGRDVTREMMFSGDLRNNTPIVYDHVEVRLGIYNQAGARIGTAWADCKWMSANRTVGIETVVPVDTYRVAIEEISGC